MAARKKVVACEVNQRLAEVAAEIIADNGFQDKIEVYARHSGELRLGEELPERARVIVSEIVDAALIGEGVLPSLRHARTELGSEDLVMIPAGATLHAQLIALPDLRTVNPVRQVEGFDLSRFDRFRNRESFGTVRLGQVRHQTLSEPVLVEEIDFANLPAVFPDEQPKLIALEFTATAKGVAHGIVLWFDLHLDGETTVSTGQNGELVHWGQAAGYFPEDLTVKPGMKVSLQLFRTDTNWIIGEVNG